MMKKIYYKRLLLLLFLFMFVLLLPSNLFAHAEEITNPDPTFQEASVHDPSVIKVDDTFYVFGSHLAAAKTKDFMNWEQISSDVTPDNPLFDNVIEELDEAFEWATKVSLWAPDVIQLKDGKFYMYYNAAEGTSPRSALGVAVSSNIEGPYKDLGIFLRTGMWDEISEDGTIYNANIHPNAIDPHTFFDNDNKLWMVYGSYSGGIFILEMDPETGFPIEGQGYGTKLMGGNHSRIEAPYIQYVPETGYYYLYITYGGLDASGGYNMRVVRSKQPDGPYVDAEGNDMTNVKGKHGSFFDDESIEPFGVKLMGNYLFERDLGEEGIGIGTGYVSPGHNSVYYDENTGEQLLIFHSRFLEKGETHEIRVHQMFMNESGWPVVAPYRYSQEKVDKVEIQDVVGEYQFVNHGKEITSEIKKSVRILLNEDGTLSGIDGTWKIKGDNSAEIIIDGDIYKGLFLEQWDPTSKKHVMTLTALSDSGVSIWASQMIKKTDEEIVNDVKKELSLGNTNEVFNDLTLPNEATRNTKIFWKTTNAEVVTEKGIIHRPEYDQDPVTAELIATIIKNDVKKEKSFSITVMPKYLTGLVAHYSFNDHLKDETGQVDPGKITGDRVDSKGGVITFEDGVDGGQAAVFNGNSGVRLPNNLINSNQYSISLWLKPNELTDFTPTFFGAMTDVSWISLTPSGPANSETMVWSGSDLGTGWYDANTGLTIPINEWSNVIFTVDEGKIKLYINGELRFEGKGFPNIFTQLNSVFALGVNYWDIPYKGLMDELLIYNDYVITDEQIINYYENGEIPDLDNETIDIAELENLLKKYQSISNQDERYTEESYAAFKKTIQEVETMLADIQTEAEVDENLEKLKNAKNNLKKNSVNREVDITELENLLKKYQSISNQDERYTEESYAAFKKTIQEVESLLADIQTEAEVDELLRKLKDAKNNLEKNSVDPEIDTTELENLLKKYQSISNQDNEYTEYSFKNFQRAIELAKAELLIIDSKDRLDQTIHDLQVGYNELEKIEDEVTIKEESSNDQEETGESLPNTATSIYNKILIGFIVLLLGGFILVFTKRKKLIK